MEEKEALVQIGAGAATDSSADRPGVYIKTFGCQMNEYDSEKLLRILESGYRAVDDPTEAKLILVNTCSVREKPEHKMYSLLGTLRELKAGNSDVMVGVGGCVAQQEGQNIIDKSPVVDFVFGTHNLSLVPSLIELRKAGAPPQVAIDYRDEWEELPLGVPGNGRASVFVSISRGCNKNCAYCIVPVTRGKEVSRAREEILREVRIAAHRGAREVVLLGQTVNSYGLDLHPRIRFVELLEEVSQVQGIERIRFTSPHPQEIRADFIDLVCENPKVCRHVHMPLQSGSDKILKAMNRNYRREKYLRIIDALKTRVPDMAITTDIIVGFPGETRVDFEDTLDVMKLIEFEGSYSFAYSNRPGTPASQMEDQIAEKEKRERLYELQELQEIHTQKRLADWIGKRCEVLLDGFSKADSRILQGRNSQNLVVHLDAEYPSFGPGMFVEVEVTQANRFTLQGKLFA